MENQNKKKIWIPVLIFFILLFLISAGIIVFNLMPQKNDLSDKYHNKETSSKSEKLPDNPIDFALLQKDYPNAIGWLKVDGVNVDYPIMMSSEDMEENFYINHDIDDTEKRAGSIYVQRLNSEDFSDFNTVVYGHNMLNGTMFGTLKKFRNKEFFDENRNIYVYAPGHIFRYKIISAFVHDDRHLLNSYAFATKEGRKEFIDVCKNPNTLAKNLIDNISIKDDDRLITLSTCTSVDNERYLVVGKLIKDTKTK